MASFRRVAPHPSPLSLQLKRQNAPIVSPFSTMTSHGRGNLNMEEAEENCGFDPADEAQFSEFDPADEAQFSEFDPADEAQFSEFGPADEARSSEFDPADEAQFSEFGPADEARSSEFDPADEARSSEFGPADEARSSEFGRDERDERDERGELVGPATRSKKEWKKKGKWKKSNSSSFRGIDPDDTTVYPTTSELAHKILRKTWGFDEFRPRQEEAISRLIHGGSAVTVFPTGGGKSLVFQIPALALDEYDESKEKKKGGISIVVSPLIALIKVCRLKSQRREMLSFLT